MATTVLCAVQHRPQHVYALRVVFEDGVTLARYPDACSKPRLRPATYGGLDLAGLPVGEIRGF